jgi:hypothetical protein
MSSKLTSISVELDLGFAFGRTAQTAYSKGHTFKGDDNLQAARNARNRAAGLISRHEAEEFSPRLQELETLLGGLEKKDR